MLRLQGTDVMYNEINLGPVEDMEYMGGIFAIFLDDGSSIGIPEMSADSTTQEVFAAYHEFYKNTGGIKPPDTVSLEQIKAAKIAELSEECYKRTIAGIDFTWENETKHYSLEVGDQIKLISMYSEVLAGKDTVSWHANGEKCTPWSAEKFLAFFNQATYYIKLTELAFNSGLRPQVYGCTSAEEVNQIFWDMELDEDIQRNLDRLIAVIG